MLVETQAPGKLILIGEYVVLEGAPSLVCAVDRYAKVKISESETEYYLVSAPSIDIENVPFSITSNGLILFENSVDMLTRKKLSFFKTTFEYAWQYCKSCRITFNPFKIVIDTDAFYSAELNTKLGFGSSAALTVALVKALFKLSGKSPDDLEELNKIFRLSLAAHKKAQGGLGSGIDIAASSMGGVLEYRVGINNRAEQLLPEKVKVWEKLKMLVVFTGSSESTRKMVAGVGQLKKEKPEIYKQLMSDLETSSVNGCKAYKKNDISLFFKEIKNYNDLMSSLGEKSGMPIISPVHQKISEVVVQSGGVYKPSGAGSGDIGIAFAENAEQIIVVKKAIEKSGFTWLDVKIASEH
ncbi:MAG: hypothetical protein D8M58_15715 [Calditrichaeota bacterium]|nr:MAG: hypothetical protein DWQ03_07445 [Calditrichota bacterium]MBL1206852.1 hypothetical protein [Calditrichota bacterium]NOG46679.1 hypothetical protein [Calditrichota bacterium]